jgi:hypothetical protein
MISRTFELSLPVGGGKGSSKRIRWLGTPEIIKYICSWLITGFVTRLTQRVLQLQQELLTLPEHLRSPQVFSGIRVARSLVFWNVFINLIFIVFKPCSFQSFGFSHNVIT